MDQEKKKAKTGTPDIFARLFGRRTGAEKASGGAGANPVSTLGVPISVTFTPFSLGAEFDEAIRKDLGVSRLTLKLDEELIDPLLVESRAITTKLLMGVGPHNETCPHFTGEILPPRTVAPSALCSPCGVNCDIGTPMTRFPVCFGEKCVGTLTFCLDRTAPELESPEFRASLAARLSSAIENAVLRETNRLLEITDSLTRAHNYRFFIKTIEQELDRSRRYDHPFSLVLIDIDRLSAINNEYGYETGDSILKETASILRKNIRTTDFVARYSGGRFVVILTETSSEGAHVVAEKLVSTAEKIQIAKPGVETHPRIAITAGVASFPQDAQLPARLIAFLEENLKKAKNEKIGKE